MMEVIVEEGDELFLPSQWMHEVTSLSSTTSTDNVEVTTIQNFTKYNKRRKERKISISTSTWWRPR